MRATSDRAMLAGWRELARACGVCGESKTRRGLLALWRDLPEALLAALIGAAIILAVAVVTGA